MFAALTAAVMPVVLGGRFEAAGIYSHDRPIAEYLPGAAPTRQKSGGLARRHRLERRSLLKKLIVFALLTGCTVTGVDLPPVAPDSAGQQSQGRVIWHDLVTDDPEAVKRFYGELLGWQFRAVAEGDYHLILNQGRAIGGMVDGRRFQQQGSISQWVVVLSVADLDDSVAAVTGSGGRLIGGPADLGRRGRLALAEDPRGAIFAMLQTLDGDPPEREAAVGEFMWNELWTDDAERSRKFYRELMGYRQGELHLDDGTVYRYLEGNGRPRAAVTPRPAETIGPTWVSIIRVADVSAVSDRVESLGGDLLLPARSNPIGGELAVIRDPSGAGFVIQTWNYENKEPDS